MSQRPLNAPPHLPSSSTAPHQQFRPYQRTANHTLNAEPSVARQPALHRPAAALPSSPPAQRPGPSSARAEAHSPGQLASPQNTSAATADAAGPAAIDYLSILRNAGLANPLASLSGAGAEATQAVAQAAAGSPGSSQKAADGTRAAADSDTTKGAAVGSGMADAGPVLAGDDRPSDAPDVGSNLMALLSKLAPVGQ